VLNLHRESLVNVLGSPGDFSIRMGDTAVAIPLDKATLALDVVVLVEGPLHDLVVNCLNATRDRPLRSGDLELRVSWNHIARFIAAERRCPEDAVRHFWPLDERLARFTDTASEGRLITSGTQFSASSAKAGTNSCAC
jgi:hypothetical protein